MRRLLTTTALLALLVAGAGWAQAQNAGGNNAGSSGSQNTSSGASGDQGGTGTTGKMTTTPQAKSGDAAGTQGETMQSGCAPGQTPAVGQKC